MAQTVTILGINGRFGQEVGKAFVAANWRVIGMGRANKAKLSGVEFIKGDARNIEDTVAAVAAADVVVNALNLPYDKWENGGAERQLAGVLSALKGSGKTLLFPGNIYNYAADQHLITPDIAQRPEKEKGRIRKRMEGQLAQASSEDNIQVLVIRLADFFAPDATGSMFDLAMLTRVKKNILQYPGDLNLKHSWAFLPDVGRAFVKVAEERQSQPNFESFHYAGHFVSGQHMVDAVQAVLPNRMKIQLLPWKIMGVIGWFNPVLREVVKMKYLWEVPHQLRDEKMSALLGADFGTGFEKAVADTVRSYLPEELKKSEKKKLIEA